MSYRHFFKFTLVLYILPFLGCSGASAKRAEYLQLVAQSQDKYKKLTHGDEIDGEKAGEAKDWLEFTNRQNILPNSTRKQTLEHVLDLYEAGAEKVYCIYVVKEANFRANVCSSLLIQMPKDAEKRKEIIKTLGKIEKEFWGKAAGKLEDAGHNFLHLNMDP